MVDSKLLLNKIILLIIITVIDRFVEMNLSLEEYKDSEYILYTNQKIGPQLESDTIYVVLVSSL